ncbi:MAG: hypothetical protein WCN92_05725 [Eubacteriales bacterium]
MGSRKSKRRIPDDMYRIIKISKEALFEFIYESMIDNQECFMNVDDGTSIISCFDINWETGEFIFIARKDKGNEEDLGFPDINTQVLLSKLKDTTNTIYKDNRFIELTAEEIKIIQNGSTNSYTNDQPNINGLNC